MFLLLLLVFPLVSAVPDITNLVWQPDRVTKESILAEHNKKLRLPEFPGIPTLAYVTPWNARGFKLARDTADRLTHVSPVWINLKPVYDESHQISDVNIEGDHNILQNFIDDLRKKNENIKIVPRFKFGAEDFPSYLASQMMLKEPLILKITNKIVKYCKKYKFDGLVLEILDAVFHGNAEERSIALESMGFMGEQFRKYGLHVIMSIPPPVPYRESGEYSSRDGFLSQDECQDMVKHFDFVQLWTYSDQASTNRGDIKIWVDANLKRFGYSKKIMIGLNFYGQEFTYDSAKSGNAPVTQIIAQRFLKALKDKDSVLEFDPTTVEHVLRSKGSVIFFPSMTNLEYRISQAYERNMGIAVWEYGQGLDYFTDLI